MANPNKYADLPGVALDQPDVYETNDLPESDQSNLEGFGDQSETVEKITISTSDAYEKFKGQKLDAAGVDFTDSIKKSRHSGYGVTSGEWELLGNGSPETETPQQRYQRLKHEMSELLEEVNNLKETSKSDENQDQTALVDLSMNVESLQNQIVNVNLYDILGTELIANISDPHGTLQKKLVTEIGTFKATDTAKAANKATEDPNKNGITYKIIYKPTDSQKGVSSKATDLESRIKKLEALLGSDENKLSLLTTPGQGKTLLSSINYLSSRLNLLDPANLEVVEARLSYLSQHLQQMADKKSQLDNLEKQNKIMELYDLAKKTESMSEILPKVVERLESLQQVHDQAMQFKQALSQLETIQQQLLITLKNDEKFLKEAQDSFSKNSDVLHQNVKLLDERISKLKKWSIKNFKQLIYACITLGSVFIKLNFNVL